MANEHPYRDEDFELYALGVLEGDEAKPIASHVASCPACAQKLTDARGRVAMIALTAERQAPSLAPRQRLLDQVRAEAAPSGDSSRTGAQRPPQNWWNAIWATAAFALAACAVILWMANSRLNNEIQQLNAEAQAQAQQLKHERAMAALLTSPQTKTVDLAPKAPMATQAGRVMYNAQLGALIYAGNLPQLAANKSYELWIIPQSGNPIPAGVFAPQANGEANIVMPQIPTGVAAKAFAVTIEPAGGTPAPTGPMAQVGAAGL